MIGDTDHTSQDQVTIIEPNGIRRTRPLTGKVGIGRGVENELMVVYNDVSRRHAEISYHAGRYYVTDLGSANGTYLGDVLLPPNEPTVWMPGQSLRVGRVLVTLDQAAPPSEEGADPPLSPAGAAPDRSASAAPQAPQPPSSLLALPQDKLTVVLSMLIVIAVLVTVAIAWRSSGVSFVEAGRAGDVAALNAESVRLLSDAALYNHYRAYTAFVFNRELERACQKSIDRASAAELPDLERQRIEAANLAQASRARFPACYLNRDESYALRRELGKVWVKMERRLDLDPSPHWVRADQRRIRLLWLKGLLVVQALAMVFLNLGRAFHPARNGLRYTMTLSGALCLLLGAAGFITVELTL